MPGKNDDDLFDGDDAEAIDEFGQLSQMLLERVSEFAEEEDINDDALPLMLLNVAVTLRATAYPISVAKPSVGGLKLDLDRFGRAADDMIRELKKDANRFLEEAKALLAEEDSKQDET
jgi:hypothetical protein